MTVFIDLKYIGIVSSKLNQFKKNSDNLYNFRCPYCGDSKTSHTKARGYLFLNKTFFVYKCHNCEKSTDFSNLLKTVDNKLHDEYIFEIYKNKNVYIKDDNIPIITQPVFHKGDFLLKKLKKISQLRDYHPAKQIIERRRIPSRFHYKLYFAPKFFEWVNKIVPNKFPSNVKDHPRLVIPFLDKRNKMFAFQGRAFGKEEPKYFTISLNEDRKIYGLDKVNWSKKVYVVEGPIDSLFLDNCVATANSDLRIEEKKEDIILVPDNQPRNLEIVKRIQTFIDQDYSVCLWPENIKEKDINDMVLSGIKDIKQIINENTFRGLEAKVHFKTWRKING